MANIVTKVGIELEGKMVVPAEYSEITPIVFDNGKQSENIFKCVKKDELTLILLDNDENYEFDPIFSITFANEKCIGVSIYDERHGEKFALIDTQLDMMTNYVYDSIEPITDTIYKTKIDGLFGIIDNFANEILPNKYKEIIFDKSNETYTVKV